MKQPPAIFLWKHGLSPCSSQGGHAKSATSAILFVSYHKNAKMTSE
ncbi:hypothetical protein HMPREF9081_2155 [Centipeda periodontii DSM 2778]|uniref:Uncharacterized protein n=1 Tax=Centipeda periodontii DSM 2778 TaxID=888060 RepID=F5RPG9_9FIRM|nr:hypothetical protein HMPREF9081_2155 [Centipeda periodontii DSM 2778]